MARGSTRTACADRRGSKLRRVRTTKTDRSRRLARPPILIFFDPRRSAYAVRVRGPRAILARSSQEGTGDYTPRTARRRVYSGRRTGGDGLDLEEQLRHRPIGETLGEPGEEVRDVLWPD